MAKCVFDIFFPHKDALRVVPKLPNILNDGLQCRQTDFEFVLVDIVMESTWTFGKIVDWSYIVVPFRNNE